MELCFQRTEIPCKTIWEVPVYEPSCWVTETPRELLSFDLLTNPQAHQSPPSDRPGCPLFSTVVMSPHNAIISQLAKSWQTHVASQYRSSQWDATCCSFPPDCYQALRLALHPYIHWDASLFQQPGKISGIPFIGEKLGLRQMEGPSYLNYASSNILTILFWVDLFLKMSRVH